MEKINFEDGQLVSDGYVEIDGEQHTVTEAEYTGTTPLSAFNLNKLQDNIEHHYYTKTLTENLVNSELELPASYKVGTGCLRVYFEGVLLDKEVNYEEIGEPNAISNKIKIDWLTGWKEEIDAESLNFSFVIQGTYDA